MGSVKEEPGTQPVVRQPSGKDRLLTMELGRQGKAMRHEISAVGRGELSEGRERQD